MMEPASAQELFRGPAQKTGVPGSRGCGKFSDHRSRRGKCLAQNDGVQSRSAVHRNHNNGLPAGHWRLSQGDTNRIDLLQQLSRLAAEHEADLCVAFNSKERVTFEVGQLDLASPSSIDRFANEFLNSNRALDLLINNEGIMEN